LRVRLVELESRHTTNFQTTNRATHAKVRIEWEWPVGPVGPLSIRVHGDDRRYEASSVTSVVNIGMVAEQRIDVPITRAGPTVVELSATPLAGEVSGGLFAAEDGLLQPARLVHGLASAAQRHGARIITGTALTELQPQADGLLIQTARGQLKTANQTYRAAVASAIRSDNKESAASMQAAGALRNANYGDCATAKSQASDSLKQVANGANRPFAALVFAVCGDSASPSVGRSTPRRSTSAAPGFAEPVTTPSSSLPRTGARSRSTPPREPSSGNSRRAAIHRWSARTGSPTRPRSPTRIARPRRLAASSVSVTASSIRVCREDDWLMMVDYRIGGVRLIPGIAR